MLESGSSDLCGGCSAMSIPTANLLTARMPEGRMLGDTVGFNKWLAQFGREINPTATLVPVNDPDAGKTISTEITDIEMKTRGRAA
jgi:hypothetical protein